MRNTTPRRRSAPFVAGLVGGGLLIISKLWRKSKTTKEDVEILAEMPTRFPYEDLRVATDDFAERIGRGGYGSVFKGALADGTRVAVKCLDKLDKGNKANKAEEDRLIDIVENVDECMQSDKEEMLRMIKIGAWCLQDDPERRPLMSTIVKILDGVMEVDTNLVYEFSHSLIASPIANHHISSTKLPASVLSNPR
ncbi:hypothetical protein H0E87_009387 [Populus deltoides]|uniref:Protein kinase domain-containing protein n=1 Tax=Populus deltoides TaxID=3696 RepID=A0A8T2Z4D4_POPDE|nr:hypothetical protein H0E87_009387 [Populus deltoides]